MYDSARPTQRLTWGGVRAFANANGGSDPLNIKDFKYATLTMIGSAFSGVIKCATAGQDAQPDFAATAADTNAWATHQIDEYEDSAPIVGDTGITFAAFTGVRTFRLNADMVHWLGFVLSGYSGSGTLKIDVELGNDQAS